MDSEKINGTLSNIRQDILKLFHNEVSKRQAWKTKVPQFGGKENEFEGGLPL